MSDRLPNYTDFAKWADRAAETKGVDAVRPASAMVALKISHIQAVGFYARWKEARRRAV